MTSQSLITIGVNMTDTIMLGKPGDSSVGFVFGQPVYQHFSDLLHGHRYGGFGAHFSVLGHAGQALFAESHHDYAAAVLAFGLVFTAATIITPDGLMRIYTSEPDIIQAGASYFRWSIPCYWLLGFSLTCTIVLRSVGQVRLPLICSICAFFVNVFFNYLFIFGAFGSLTVWR